MSHENVEIVKAALDAYSRGDWDTLLKDLAPDFEFDLSRSIAFVRGVYGREQLQQILSEFGEPFESMRPEYHEFIEVGEHVIVPVTTHMVGRDGIEVQARAFGLGRSETEPLPACAFIRSGKKPSKPPSVRSRRCRRRTSKWSGGSTRSQ